MSDQEQSQQPRSEEQPNADVGSLDEAVRALTQRSEAQQQAKPSEGEQSEASTEPEPAADEAPEAGEDEAGEELAEVEFEGKTYKVPPELKPALLRQADYSRSMNELGAQKQEYARRVEAADEMLSGAQSYAQALAQVQAIDAQLKSFDSIEWAKLRAENPAEYSALATDVQNLRLARTEAERQIEALGTQIQQQRARDYAAKRNEMLKTLQRDLPGWSDDLGAEITQYAMSRGYTFDEVHAVTDPRWVLAMDKARKFDRIQGGKAEAKAKAANAPPVLKPGAKPPPQDMAADAMARLRKSNSIDDAAAAFAARAQRRTAAVR